MKNQKKEMRLLFETQPDQWIPVYYLSGIGLQYNSRIHSLRREGMDIECKTEMVNGTKHSWYRYNKAKQRTLF